MYRNYEIRKTENAAATRSVWFNIYVPGNGGQIMQSAYSEAEAIQIVDRHIAETADAAIESDDYDMDEEIEKLHNGR
jgi:hypothetical protein